MRGRTRILIGLAAAAVIALVAGRALVERPASTDAAGSHAASAGAAGAPGRAIDVRVVPDPAAEELPGVHCWAGLLDVDRSGSIAELRAVLGRAIASGDELLATYVGDRLVEIVGDDVARATALLDWADATSGPELEVLLGALARTPAVQDRAVAERLLRMGEDRDGGEVRRAAALGALETQARLAPDDLARVAAVALEADAGGAAWTATRTLGRVMKEDHARTGSYAPYWDQLLAISGKTEDPAVRILALEMPAYADPVLDAGYIDDLAAILTGAPEKEVREMAAFQLGLTEDPDRVLAVFRAAFPKEQELCVRWAILRFSVRAAGARALPLLRELARVDRRFAVDVAEFEQLYASGLADFERVWLDKAEHHACGVDEEHGQEGGS